jgi:hypothetical protein
MLVVHLDPDMSRNYRSMTTSLDFNRDEWSKDEE